MVFGQGEISKNFFILKPEKNAAYIFTCKIKRYHYMLVSVLYLIYLKERYEDVILFLHPKIPRRGKFVLSIQFIFQSILLLIQISFLVQIDDFTNVIVNLGALLIINEFQTFTGEYYLQKLRTFNRDLVDSDQFFKFQDV
jgi:hypothetical protein